MELHINLLLLNAEERLLLKIDQYFHWQHRKFVNEAMYFMIFELSIHEHGKDMALDVDHLSSQILPQSFDLY